MKRVLIISLPFEESLSYWLRGEPVRGTPSLFFLAETLAKNGVEVRWVMLDWTGPLIEDRDTHVQGRITIQTLVKPTRKIARHLNATETGRFHRILKPLDFICHFVKLASIAKQFRPELIYSNGIYSVIGTPLAKRHSAASVTRMLGVFVGNSLGRWIKPVKTWNELVTLRQKPDLFIITNDGTQGDRVASHYGISPDRVWFPINGVDQQVRPQLGDRERTRDNLGVDEDTIVLMSIGRLVAWKRMDMLIESVGRIRSQVAKRIVFLCAGEGPMRSDWEQLATERNLSDSVRFLGSLSREKLREYLAATDIAAFLYDNSNVGSALLEAMVAGKAILSRNNGDTSRFVSHGRSGLLVDEFASERELDSSLICLVNDCDLRMRLGTAAGEWANENLRSWNERMDEEYRILCRLTDNKLRLTNQFAPLQAS